MGFISRDLNGSKHRCQHSDGVYKVRYVDSYIAEKSQWVPIDSAHSFTRSNRGVLQFFLSTKLGRQLVILGIWW